MNASVGEKRDSDEVVASVLRLLTLRVARGDHEGPHAPFFVM